MDKSRQLPVLMIHDTRFLVDFANLEFRQVDNPKNAISFREVRDNWNHTSLLYDPVTKNVFRGTELERSKRPDVLLLKLPAVTQLDPQSWADAVVKNLKKDRAKIGQVEYEKVERKRNRRRRGRSH